VGLTQERVQAVADYGFTERQARFLVLVMRHAGLCVKRQYAAFAGIANGGEKGNAFFDKLVRRRFAVATDCIHNRAQLYHVHHKPLYHAIGEPDSRYRRAVPARSVADRLMRLDAAIMSGDLEWLTTRSDKLAYLQARTAHEASEQSADATPQPAAEPVGQLPGTFPIGVDPGGRVVLLYLATMPWTDDFRTFLVAHTAWLRVAPAWTVRVMCPQPLRRAIAAYQSVAHEELARPLQAQTIADLKHYFFHRRRGTDLNAIPATLRGILTRYAEVFGGPRFTHLYRRWLTEQDAALTPIPPVIPEALTAGRAQIECVVLPHTYQHLSPLVRRRRARRRGRQQWEEKGDETPRGFNPSLNPVP
jgi:hypothetical protein